MDKQRTLKKAIWIVSSVATIAVVATIYQLQRY